MADRNIESIYPLTPTQEGILFHSLSESDPRVYFNQYVCLLDGELDDDTMREAWRLVIERYSVLRTLFTWEKRSRPLQIVRRRAEPPLAVHDWRDMSGQQQDAMLDQFLQADREKPLPLDVAPLMRIALIRLSARQTTLVLSFHHIILDGWSMRLVRDQVLAAYDSLSAGSPPSLPVATDYEEFVTWQAALDDSAALSFWRERLGTFTRPTTPVVKSDAGEQIGTAGQASDATLPAALSAELNAFARSRGATISQLIMAGWAMLLGRYCDASDIVFGVTVAGRGAENGRFSQTVGLLINTLPLRIEVDPTETVSGLLSQVARRQREIMRHEHVPLAEIQRCSGVPAATPLFETIVVFENLPARSPALRSGADQRLAISAEQFIEHSNFPLALLVVPAEQIELALVYDGRRYQRVVIDRLLGHFVHLLSELVRDDTVQLSQIPLMPAAERATLVEDWNRTSRNVDHSVSIIDRFEQQAQRSSDRIAIAAGADAVASYAALQDRIDELARRIAANRRGIERPILVDVNAGIDTVATMFAALKLGVPYVPVDLDGPASRLRAAVDDLAHAFPGAAPVATLVATGVSPDLPDAGVLTVVDLGADDPSLPDDAYETGEVAGVDSDALAYIIYTSGSTGRPKGVMVPRSALLNSTLARRDFYREEIEAFAMVSPLTTDSSIAGIYWTLCSGGTLVLPERGERLDAERLLELLRRHGVTHLLCVPSLYAVLLAQYVPADLPSLKAVIVAGEACSEAIRREHKRRLPHVALYNEYGPTEACVWATVAELTNEDEPGISIGRPIANTRIHILDSVRQPVPIGVAGEIYIAGDNIATGYLNNAEATDSAFVDDLTGSDGRRMYRTGDRARYLEDGRIVYLGRADDQLKVRGYRVEPGEVEAVLSSDVSVTEAAVFLDDAARLTAAVVGRSGSPIDRDALRRLCIERLPTQMLPQTIVEVAELPKTAAGKTDRAALRDIDLPVGPRSDRAADPGPRSSTEATLAGIWEEVLGLDRISIHDDFLDVGGDSLLVIRILSRMAKAGLRIGPDDFLDNPTIASQARIIRDRS